MYNLLFINNKNKQKHKIENVDCADTYIKRLLGLMMKEKFNGLIFKQEKQNRYNASIHTSFMKAPIDIIYINNKMTIQEMKTLKAWKLYIPKYGNIKYIIELPEKSIEKYHLEIEDKVVIENEQKKKRQAKKHYSNGNEHY